MGRAEYYAETPSAPRDDLQGHVGNDHGTKRDNVSLGIKQSGRAEARGYFSIHLRLRMNDLPMFVGFRAVY